MMQYRLYIKNERSKRDWDLSHPCAGITVFFYRNDYASADLGNVHHRELLSLRPYDRCLEPRTSDLGVVFADHMASLI